MCRFLTQSTLFASLLVTLLGLSIMLVPSEVMRHSMLAMAPHKEALLQRTPSPKVVLIGGSNLSHGLNSRVVSEALSRPVVNMGLHGGLGLAFMLAQVRPYVRQGDLLVVVPEYSQYDKDGFYGNREVLGVLFDIMPEKRSCVSWHQWLHLARYLPNYGAKKIVNALTGILDFKSSRTKSTTQYNEFGDEVGHWSMARKFFAPQRPIKECPPLAGLVFDELERFDEAAKAEGARVIFLPPCLQATSFDNVLPLVAAVERELSTRALTLVAPMRRYRMEDSLCFDTPYHLTKEGVELRSSLLAQDLARFIGGSTELLHKKAEGYRERR